MCFNKLNSLDRHFLLNSTIANQFLSFVHSRYGNAIRVAPSLTAIPNLYVKATYRKFFSSILIFFIFIKIDFASATNLNDAIQAAQDNNRNIRLEQLRLNSIKTEKTKAIAEFLPNISANVTYGQRNSFFQGQTYDRSTRQRTQQINLEQPIFDGLGSVARYRQADYRVKSSMAKKSDKIQEISFAAAQSYCNLFRYQELVKIQEENKKLSKKFFDLVARRKEVRIIDNADIIKFNYETSLIEEKYFDSLNRLKKAQFDYQNIVGQLDENLTLTEIDAVAEKENFDKEKVIKSAIQNNYNLNSFRNIYFASKAAYNAEKSAFLPKVSVTASADRQDKVVYLNNQDLNSRSLFLNVSIPIFQKGVEYANLNKARYDRDAAREELEINKEAIIKEVSQTLAEYEFLLQLHKTNKKLFELAKKRAQIFIKRSDLKVEDPIETIRAKIEANDRKINYIESTADLAISYYKIKYFLSEI
jgi:outer membrane protein TolC